MEVAQRKAIEAYLKHEGIPRELRKRIDEFYDFRGGVSQVLLTLTLTLNPDFNPDPTASHSIKERDAGSHPAFFHCSHVQS